MHRSLRIVAATLVALLVIPAFAGAVGAQTDGVRPDRAEPDRIAPESDVSVREAPATDVAVPDVPVRDAPVRDVPDRDVPERDVPVRDVAERDEPVRDVPERDRLHCNDSVNDRSVDDCAGIDLDDPEVVRKLIHRLIAAGQWKTLVRLLHAIGVL